MIFPGTVKTDRGKRQSTSACRPVPVSLEQTARKHTTGHPNCRRASGEGCRRPRRPPFRGESSFENRLTRARKYSALRYAPACVPESPAENTRKRWYCTIFIVFISTLSGRVKSTGIRGEVDRALRDRFERVPPGQFQLLIFLGLPSISFTQWSQLMLD